LQSKSLQKRPVAKDDNTIDPGILRVVVLELDDECKIIINNVLTYDCHGYRMDRWLNGRFGIVVRRMNAVNLRWARLVLGWQLQLGKLSLASLRGR